MSTYFALVNLNSESVRCNIGEIILSISKLSKRLGAQIDHIFSGLYDVQDETWRYVDIQFEKARPYSHLFVFGGDGTHTHVLNLIAQSGIDIKFIGISCGTMNIGRYSNMLSDLEHFDSLTLEKHDAIRCVTSDGRESFSCIDSVITTTCVARINGIITQLSARDILGGLKIQSKPEMIGNKETKIAILHQSDVKRLPVTPEIYTISVAFLPSALKAQVMAGGADPAACANFLWGVIVSDFPLVWADATKKDIQKKPILSVFYPLDVKDIVEINFLNPNAYLVNDGNAICNISSAKFYFMPAFFKTYRLERHYERRSE